MKLADFLQWEVPKKAPYGGARSEPSIWIRQDFGKKYPSYAIIINNAFIKAHLPDELKVFEKNKKKTHNVGISVSIDRGKKLLKIVFNPPKNMPQFLGRIYGTNNGTLNLTNKMLGDEIWTLFGMNEKAPKQYFEIKLGEVVEDHQIYELSYNPESQDNIQALIQNVRSRKK